MAQDHSQVFRVTELQGFAAYWDLHEDMDDDGESNPDEDIHIVYIYTIFVSPRYLFC